MNGITFLIDTPNIHIHMLTTDELADTQGYSDVELVCHACGRYIKILHKLPLKGDPVLGKIGDDGVPRINKIRDDFEKQHKTCVPAMDVVPLIGFAVEKGNAQFKTLCPPWRKFGHPEETFDLRNEDIYKF